MSDFDEGLHPRGDGGKFAGAGGPSKPAKTGKLFQNQPTAKKPRATKPKVESKAASPAAKEESKVESKPAAPKSEPKKREPKKPKDPHEQLKKLKPADAATTDALVNGSKMSDGDKAEFESQRARTSRSLSPKETASLKAYVNPDADDYKAIRAAEIGKTGGPHGDHAKTIKAALNREIAQSQPVQLYRGMSVPPDVASKLMSGRSLDLKATSSFSPKASEALDFSTGFGEAASGNIPVVISGRMRGVAIPHSPEVESLMPAKKLKIVGKSVVHHSVHGPVLVLHVAD